MIDGATGHVTIPNFLDLGSDLAVAGSVDIGGNVNIGGDLTVTGHFSTDYWGGFGGYENLILYSHQMGQWDVLSGSRDSLNEIGPNGQSDAAEWSGGVGDWFHMDLPRCNYNTVYNVSFWAKKISGDGTIEIDLGDPGSYKQAFATTTTWVRYEGNIQTHSSHVHLNCAKTVATGTIQFWGWQVDKYGPRGYCATEREIRIGDGSWSNGTMDAKMYGGSMVYEIVEFVVPFTPPNYDNFSVAETRTIILDTESGDFRCGGFSGGVTGQEIVLIKNYSSGNIILEHNEGSGEEKILTPTSADITISNYGSVTLMFDPDGWWMVTGGIGF